METYGRLCTAFYDLDKPFAPADAIAFYLAKAAEAGGPVLEPMCGSGRFLIPLLQAGIPIEGTDASAEMLAACKLRAERVGLTPKLYEQRLEELSLPDLYSLAFIPSGSLGLIHEQQSLRSCLKRLYSHLAPSASLYIELVDVESFASGADDFGSRSVAALDGKSIRYEWRSRFDAETRMVHWDTRYELRQGDSILTEESELLLLRIHTAQEMLDELGLAGFSNPQVVPDTNETAWLRNDGCSLYACTVPAFM